MVDEGKGDWNPKTCHLTPFRGTHPRRYRSGRHTPSPQTHFHRHSRKKNITHRYTLVAVAHHRDLKYIKHSPTYYGEKHLNSVFFEHTRRSVSLMTNVSIRFKPRNTSLNAGLFPEATRAARCSFVENRGEGYSKEFTDSVNGITPKECLSGPFLANPVGRGKEGMGWNPLLFWGVGCLKKPPGARRRRSLGSGAGRTRSQRRRALRASSSAAGGRAPQRATAVHFSRWLGARAAVWWGSGP